MFALQIRHDEAELLVVADGLQSWRNSSDTFMVSAVCLTCRALQVLTPRPESNESDAEWT